MSGLHEALAKVQANLPAVAKSKTARIPTKSGGEFSYSYADLADVTDAVLPVLAAEGLTWVCTPEPSDRGWMLVGRLTHAESCEAESGYWPLPSTDDPQRMGSAVTYARRYLLCAAVGLVPDDDDDGRRAQPPPRSAEPAAPDFTVLTELVAEAEHAGVRGDFDALVEFAEQSDANLVAAIGKLRNAIQAAA